MWRLFLFKIQEKGGERNVIHQTESESGHIYSESR
jgi:hypothetical protein